MSITIEEFGTKLIRTGDLDPTYIAIYNAKLDSPTLHRLCLAYWCFYSLAAAARIAEEKIPTKYWLKMAEAADNVGEPKPWPRGAERRHFRGTQAIEAVEELRWKYKTATDAVYGLTGYSTPERGVPTYAHVSKAAMSHRGFGEWIAFKIADMSERVLGMGTDFTHCELGIYKDPRQGAALAWYEHWGATGGPVLYSPYHDKPWEYPIKDDELKDAVAHYIKVFRKKGLKAPPAGDRLVNVQEIETIFCKYKSCRKGHYPLGKDTSEIRHGLTTMRSDLGDQLLIGMVGLPA